MFLNSYLIILKILEFLFHNLVELERFNQLNFIIAFYFRLQINHFQEKSKLFKANIFVFFTFCFNVLRAAPISLAFMHSISINYLSND